MVFRFPYNNSGNVMSHACHCHPRARGRLAMCTGNEREHNYRKYGTVKARPYGARPGLQGNSEEERTLLTELGTGARGRWRGGVGW